eukprot:CAMPEP_0184315746 /NCGR_PEP_ID=MMETSP1049-20130417/85243_1 /TAXON_ID=77928 /ORGANISM="Proteomonas sulcata, Strain CCMP704" /LENGTH=110 /DNA_ID=CAMNT_0026634417 /DNA_START=223 /DNA_END=555 /DNA_ORIENTATION=+
MDFRKTGMVTQDAFREVILPFSRKLSNWDIDWVIQKFSDDKLRFRFQDFFAWCLPEEEDILLPPRIQGSVQFPSNTSAGNLRGPVVTSDKVKQFFPSASQGLLRVPSRLK